MHSQCATSSYVPLSFLSIALLNMVFVCSFCFSFNLLHSLYFQKVVHLVFFFVVFFLVRFLSKILHHFLLLKRLNFKPFIAFTYLKIRCSLRMLVANWLLSQYSQLDGHFLHLYCLSKEQRNACKDFVSILSPEFEKRGEEAPRIYLRLYSDFTFNFVLQYKI